MKSAKEMFEEQGWTFEENNEQIIYTRKQEYNDTHFGVVFSKDGYSYHTYCFGWFEDGSPWNSNLSITKELHKAINKQYQELVKEDIK